MGVKSLWSLLAPVGRPVLLETVEGKVMAIDSSIWIYQFQATMRDKEGRALTNAHVVGFLRRISKLLFYGIKPVFVFDGGAPALKKTTLRERREKKSGAAASHAKLAEKLLAAQMRREALKYADSSHGITPKDKGKHAEPSLDDDNTVYLEDIESSMAKTPAKKLPAPTTLSKKAKFHDHDPYTLPEVDLEAEVAKATRTAAPDPRLATEDELRAFIDEMRPEDFDVTSPAFRELPTEVQYEIVGDLRLKSRQTSYARLQKMLRNAPTPLDFSKQQIKNLRQRNTLTQQLLITTDSIGSAHISIPVRIASERNKEYVLMKNEGDSGGWILGIRDDGTQQKPIEIDQGDKDVVDEDSEEEMEEVPISVPDPDLREYQQTMALSAIGKHRPAPSLPIYKKSASKPLFELDDDDELVQALPEHSLGLSDEEDNMIAIAIQQSLDQAPDTKNIQRRELSPALGEPSSSKMSSNTSVVLLNSRAVPSPGFNDGDFVFESPSRLETALSIANAGPARPHLRPASQSSPSIFGRPTLLSSSTHPQISPVRVSRSTEKSQRFTHDRTELSLPPERPKGLSPPVPAKTPHIDAEPELIPVVSPKPTTISIPETMESDSDEDMEEVITNSIRAFGTNLGTDVSPESIAVEDVIQESEPPSGQRVSISESNDDRQGAPVSSSALYNTSPKDDGEEFFPWSRSPSPSHELPTNTVLSRPHSPVHEEWDAAEEMDPRAEEGDYARFISQVKGKDIEDVRREIDDEIKHLNQQRKAALRDSEDITQQMISQIMAMLRLFGIPYITAPMEAEAQCAELVNLGLVDGVITDDSDVFLFGAQHLARDLGLERDTLIHLAYLLGSDYVDGLPGVGPVVAMELLKEFPGGDGLIKFRDWWLKVQTGKDKEEDNKSKFRKQFKKKFKDLFLTEDWPNPAVRDAYYQPTVDSSDEPFKWGSPDLDALRAFFREELGWGQAKVDEILLPIIQRVNKRGQAAALNKQSNLTEFFDLSAGNGTYAPKNRQAYTSKRLQNVVDDFRKKRMRGSATPQPGSRSGSRSDSEEDYEPTKKRMKMTSGKGKADAGSSESVSSGKAAKGKKRAGSSRAKKPSSGDEFEDREEPSLVEIPLDPVVVARLRPRPKPRYAKPQDAVEDAE
ncbi:hypothetical protein D9615_004449 [Tricholomella constricta]|uniref:PIN domain-like protein n=1 Tax=Tricholomella constricta TaxID=117010 RepID=A0A8H5HEQ5_9AGAR|nr:hypothetical protein D9615_004449 [Tricholomella constricta]